jgi:hypothetical protein
MPLGTIARLVQKESSIGPVTVGCLNSLYKSVADMDQGCFSTDVIQQMLLQPINSAEDYCNTLKHNIDDSQPVKFFVCDNYNSCCCPGMTIPTYKDKHKCHCGKPFTLPVFFKHCCQGFVNTDATFVITDNLTVRPNSIDYTSFSLLQEFGINSPNSVKEVVVSVPKEKVLDLLKCSLLSESTLTHLFLGKKPPLGSSRLFSFNVEISHNNIEIILKLVIRKSDGKVLYAQGEQNFANLLLSFLTYPLGGVTRIFGECCYLGSINGLYKSVADLNENKYLISKQAKNRLVTPCIAPQIKLSKQILPIFEPGVHDYYGYQEGNSNIIHAQFLKPGENRNYTANLKPINFSKAASLGESYVKGPAMYVATDDLVVSPLSPISALSLLNRLKTPLNDLKEIVVTIGAKECLSILKAALTSKSALTNGLAHLLTEVKEETS